VSRGRIGILALLAVGAVLAVTWFVPTFAGPVFVTVRAVLVPLDDGGAVASVRLPDGSVANASGVRVDLVVTNRYPLPVIASFQGPAFVAVATPTDADTRGLPWTVTADDPTLEQTDDSPDLGAGDRVALVDPGEHATEMTPGAPTFDLAASGGRLLPGTYSVDVSAYGVTAAPVQLVVLPGPTD